MSTPAFDQLVGIFRSVFNDPALEVHGDLSAVDVEMWDSLTHIQLIIEIENAFNVKFALGELEAMKNVGDLITTLGEKGSAI